MGSESRVRRRGVCPGLLDPMLTGDGWLARLSCIAPVPLSVFAALCEASRAHGSGSIEVTQRGNMQFRGLTATSASEFARKVSSLALGSGGRIGLGAGIGSPEASRVIANPLAGLDALEEIDTRALQARLLQSVDFDALGPKVSVLLDGGGPLHLDDVRADIRLRASCGRFHLAVGGDAHSALAVGWLRPEDTVDTVERLVNLIAARGRAARGRDLAEGIESLRTALTPLIAAGTPPQMRPPAEPIGIHALKGAGAARGVALPFGHSTADALQRLAQAAAMTGAEAIRPAPGRSLLVVGLSPAEADELARIAEADFVIAPNDPRRHVVACIGRPGCASGSLPTRELAPAIARAAGSFLDGSVAIHLSGCAKGCAHPGSASVTLSGPDRLVINGTAADAAHGTCTTSQLAAGLERLSAERDRQACDSAELLSRLGPGRVLQLLHGEGPLG